MATIVKENCYMYSLWSGRFICYSGTVYQTVRGEKLAGFKSKTKHFFCSIEPKIVYNAVVWLAEKDDELAKKILIDYEESQIASLQEKIENYKNQINILKQGAIYNSNI